MNHDEITLADIEDISGAFECYEVVRTFEVWRRNKNGDIRQVRIELQLGADGKYSVSAEDEEGRTATGNPWPDPHVALTLVHWHDLDVPADQIPRP